MTEALQATIEKAWDERDGISIGTGGEVRAAVVEALGGRANVTGRRGGRRP